MTIHLDRYTFLLQPDVNAPDLYPKPNPADRRRAFEILQKDQFKFLNHEIKNSLRLIIEIFGSLIPDQNMKVEKMSLNGREIYLIQFSDKATEPQNLFEGEWIKNHTIKSKLHSLSFCLYSEKLDKKHVWYVTKSGLANLSRL